MAVAHQWQRPWTAPAPSGVGHGPTLCHLGRTPGTQGHGEGSCWVGRKRCECGKSPGSAVRGGWFQSAAVRWARRLAPGDKKPTNHTNKNPNGEVFN